MIKFIVNVVIIKSLKYITGNRTELSRKKFNKNSRMHSVSSAIFINSGATQKAKFIIKNRSIMKTRLNREICKS